MIWDCSECIAGTAPHNDEEKAWLERLGFGAALVKLDTITPANVNDWLFRFRLVERMWPEANVEPIPVAAIERWIGLRTNVAPMRRSAWVSNVVKHFAADIK